MNGKSATLPVGKVGRQLLGSCLLTAGLCEMFLNSSAGWGRGSVANWLVRLICIRIHHLAGFTGFVVNGSRRFGVVNEAREHRPYAFQIAPRTKPTAAARARVAIGWSFTDLSKLVVSYSG